MAIIAIILAAIAGLGISAFLRYMRETVHGKGHSSCPPYYDCYLVVSSKYANFLGFPIELIGVAYYGLVFLIYAGLFAFPQINTPLLSFIMMTASTTAFLFSLYLTGVQLITIKKICAWCIASALLCVIIFLATLAVAGVGLLPILAQYKTLLVIIHLFGFAIGVGGATVTDLFFFKFLKDYHISKWESKILHSVSELIWVGLAILVVSGIALYLPEAARLNESSKFLAKVIVVGIILINGIVLNLYISPKLFKISFGKKHKHQKGELHYLRKAAFATGAISIVSWYTAFILGAISSSSLSMGQILFIYLIVLIVAITISQSVERVFDLRSRAK
jgi:uncharacterized membrane protein